MSAAATVGVDRKQEIVVHVTNALAEVRQCSPDEIRAEMAKEGNDLQMTAKEVMAVVAAVEDRMGIDALASPSDFATETTCAGTRGGKGGHSANGCMDPAEGASVNRVVDIIASNVGSNSFT